MSDKEKTNGSLAMAPRVITIPAANQETARKLRVAAYTRVSSNSKDQEHSFAAQNAYFSKLITDNPDWELADIYADQGITGTSIDKRDDFLRMMEDCRKGRIDRILVKSSSRFARNTKESLAAVRELKSLNISVYFEEQNIDTAQVSGEVLIAMFAALAQRESEAISERMRWLKIIWRFKRMKRQSSDISSTVTLQVSVWRILQRKSRRWAVQRGTALNIGS